MKWQDAPDKPGWWWYRPVPVGSYKVKPTVRYLPGKDPIYLSGQYCPLPDPPE
jgi:hypothetical protein